MCRSPPLMRRSRAEQPRRAWRRADAATAPPSHSDWRYGWPIPFPGTSSRFLFEVGTHPDPSGTPRRALISAPRGRGGSRVGGCPLRWVGCDSVGPPRADRPGRRAHPTGVIRPAGPPTARGTATCPDHPGRVGLAGHRAQPRRWSSVTRPPPTPGPPCPRVTAGRPGSAGRSTPMLWLRCR